MLHFLRKNAGFGKVRVKPSKNRAKKEGVRVPPSAPNPISNFSRFILIQLFFLIIAAGRRAEADQRNVGPSADCRILFVP